MPTLGRQTAMPHISWYDLWTPVVHPLEVALRAAFIYLAVQLLVRLTGRRKLARASVFDATLLFLVTVCARVAVVKDDPSITSAVVALVVMFGMDWLQSWLTARSAPLATLMEGSPQLLIRDGQVLEHALSRTHVSHEDLASQLRLLGEESFARVKEARLEPNGQVSFILARD